MQDSCHEELFDMVEEWNKCGRMEVLILKMYTHSGALPGYIAAFLGNTGSPVTSQLKADKISESS